MLACVAPVPEAMEKAFPHFENEAGQVSQDERRLDDSEVAVRTRVAVAFERERLAHGHNAQDGSHARSNEAAKCSVAPGPRPC